MDNDSSDHVGDIELASKEEVVSTESFSLGDVSSFRSSSDSLSGSHSDSSRRSRLTSNSITKMVRTHRSSLTVVARENQFVLPYLPMLLFTGSIQPHTACSPWWICWIGWRFFVGVACCIPFYTLTENFKNLDTVWVQIPAYLVPLWMSTVGAGAMWYWLPSSIAEVMVMGEPLTPQEAKAIIRVPACFIGFWVTTGVITTIVNALSIDLYSRVYLIMIGDFALACGTAPVLGAVLLAVSVDSKQAQKEVFALAEAARKKELTRYMYIAVSQGVDVRRRRWKWPLRILAALSIYSTIGLLYSWSRLSRGNHDKNIYDYDDETTSHLQIQLSAVLYLGKEAVLLFLLMLEVTRINDEADSITTILNGELWGAPGSAKEAIRTDLLFLTTTYSVRSEALHGDLKQYFLTPRSKPISFTLLGVRLTRDYVLALTVSFLIAFVNEIFQAAFVTTSTNN